MVELVRYFIKVLGFFKCVLKNLSLSRRVPLATPLKIVVLNLNEKDLEIMRFGITRIRKHTLNKTSRIIKSLSKSNTHCN